MTAIQRVRVAWTGFVGGPGVSTFYTDDFAGFSGAFSTLMASLKDSIPDTVKITVPNSGDTIDDTTGALLGSWNGTSGFFVQCTGDGHHAAPAGYMIKWETGAIHNGRRVRGRTFIVPCSSNIYDADGTLIPAFLTGKQTALDTFVASMGTTLKVWQRPRAATPSWTDVKGRTHLAKSATDGWASFVTSATIPDKTVVLRSRRD